jgi:beta-galactosidase
MGSRTSSPRWSLILACTALCASQVLASSANGLARIPISGSDSRDARAEALERERVPFDEGWRFAFGHTYDVDRDFSYGRGQPFAKGGRGPGALSSKFDDSNWRLIDLPHDWAVELPFQNGEDGNLRSHGYKPVGRAFPATTIGWYRKSFDIPASAEGKRLALEFDGVFRESEVWLNGHLACRNQSGYIGFRCDITDYVDYGGTNTLVVRVDASQVEGWFYEGAGIYRHVWLTQKNPLHISPHGVFVTTQTKGGDTRVTVRTRIVNESDKPYLVNLLHEVAGMPKARASGRVRVGPWQSQEVKLQLSIATAHLWSTEDPWLYQLDSKIVDAGAAIDSTSTTFGVRTIRFDKNEGFFLNGKHVQLKGVCLHQDHAGVGAAVPDRLQAWRMEQLKQYGVNAYRASHNPPAPELLDACDRLGILVMDENRLIGSSPEVLGQVRRLVERDRNHPSVIIWSIGNEEPEQTTPRGARIARTMIRTIKQLDATRPVTYASNARNSDVGINSVVDLRGFNYKNISDIDQYRRGHPDQILLGSEEASTYSTRGIYTNDAERAYVSAYDLNRPKHGATAEDWWTFYNARPWLAGAFVWTGFDYRGEPSPYRWPAISSQFGFLDTCGFPKDIAFYYQAWWTDQPVLHLLPHWNWAGREGQPIDVWAFSNLDSVELLLNGQSLGRQEMNRDSHLEWKVPYQPGVLEARGVKKGLPVKIVRVETTGAPAKLVLRGDRTTISADGRDVSVVTVSATDAQGRWVPIADSKVQFEMEGEGRIIGVGNGDPSSHEPDKLIAEKGSPPQWARRLFNGYAQVIVQSNKTPGRMKLRAASDSLGGSELEIWTMSSLGVGRAR